MTKNRKNNHHGPKPEGKCCAEKEAVCETSCKCEAECKSEGACKCGSGCKCCSKSSGKTAVKCLTMLTSALMISTAILFVGMEMTKPQPAPRTLGNIDLQITDYLRKNASIVIKVIEEEQERIEAERKAEEQRLKAEAQKKQMEKMKEYVEKISKDSNYYSLGNKDGKFVIIEFFDYRCGWCKRTNSALWAEIDAKKAPNIRWIPVDAPIFGEGSALISKYVLAAGKQGKYSEMHHEVASATGNLDKAALEELAKKVGLNMDQLAKDVDSDAIKNQLEANMQMAQEIGVQGVPFMIVNGKPHGGALLNESLAQAVKESNEMK
ncbi:MAG: DsbA family protein [Alphaproteobacteria bacterium]|nr:DsbA family protein [Alphaproteobacteria bacterium]